MKTVNCCTQAVYINRSISMGGKRPLIFKSDWPYFLQNGYRSGRERNDMFSGSTFSFCRKNPRTQGGNNRLAQSKGLPYQSRAQARCCTCSK